MLKGHDYLDFDLNKHLNWVFVYSNAIVLVTAVDLLEYHN